MSHPEVTEFDETADKNVAKQITQTAEPGVEPCSCDSSYITYFQRQQNLISNKAAQQAKAAAMTMQKAERGL